MMAMQSSNGGPEIPPGSPNEIPPEEVPLGIPPGSPVEEPGSPQEVPAEPPLEVPPPPTNYKE